MNADHRDDQTAGADQGPGRTRRFGAVRKRAGDYEIDTVTPAPGDQDDIDNTPEGQEFRRRHGFARNRRPFDPERTRQRLRDIAEQAADARTIVAGGKEAFLATTFDGTMRRRTAERIVEIVAEAGAKLHSEYKLGHPGPWRQMYGMRTVVVHHDDRTDPHLVWEVLSAHIPELARLLGLPEDPDGEIPLPGEGA